MISINAVRIPPDIVAGSPTPMLSLKRLRHFSVLSLSVLGAVLGKTSALNISLRENGTGL